MKYELLNNGRGILVDRTPILQDVNGTFKVSFLLSDAAQYCAVLIDSKNVKHQIQICDNEIALPKELLQPQYVKLYVVQLDNNEIIKSWDCEPIKISNLGSMLQSQWEISGGLSEASAVQRLAEVECRLAEVESIFKEQLEKYNQNITAYNKAIEVINNLSERLAALEANYDPTIIK